MQSGNAKKVAGAQPESRIAAPGNRQRLLWTHFKTIFLRPPFFERHHEVRHQ